MMNPVFKNPSLQKNFSEKGYVVMPLLDEAEVQKLLRLFELHKNQYQSPFHTSHFSTDKNYKQQVNDSIIKTVFPKTKVLMVDYRPVFGNFMIKNPGSDYFMPLHADWTYADEDQFRSIAIWIPLVDTDEMNGCLGVIEGSHKVLNKIRGPRIQQSSYRNDKTWVKKFGKLLPVKAGHAVIYDHALMHYSPPNRSGEIRPALNLSMVPEEAEVIHYCIPEGATEIEVYSVKENSFYINYDNYQRPETNSLIKTLPADTVMWIDGKMDNFGMKKKGVVQKVLDLFSL